jgi:hypothetical protein
MFRIIWYSGFLELLAVKNAVVNILKACFRKKEDRGR